jgi:hypothetical protein
MAVGRHTAVDRIVYMYMYSWGKRFTLDLAVCGAAQLLTVQFIKLFPIVTPPLDNVMF